ncbi:putative glycolipid-binding domain-containing protein [Cryptosporangium arvum]|uniref:putative glycolipid-binding domain-containing protein n=1 Tax=Cryptosporangium arvum TaxID=80871 RepID=UPI000568E016|nr:putative glycolipid-binding domain-containing protein [Cryptosporangium arvum]
MGTFAWNRVGFGAELAVVHTDRGLRARGWALGAEPEPYTSHYTLATDESWATVSLEIQTEGEGWARSLRMTRKSARDEWKVRASETGTLNGSPAGSEYPERIVDALDVDIAFSPLTNTLPIRRLDLLNQPVGAEFELNVAFVQLPSLSVISNEQRYAVAGDGEIGYRSGDYRVQITVDREGFVVDYPGLATRDQR